MTRSRGTQLLLVALALLGFGWSVAPRSAPPLYDGVGFPDEPYRFVAPPPGAKATKPPTIATGVATVQGGRVGAIHAASAETAPQVNVLIPGGRLHAPAGTGRVVVRATAVQPIAPPSHTYLWSNVYDITATPGSVTLTDASPPATITMRAATAQAPVPTIERYTGTGWVKLKTVQVGNDIYQAVLPALGRYAVIGTKKIDVSQLRGGGTTPASKTGIIVSVIAVVVVIGLAVVGVRRRSKKRRADRMENPP